MIDLPPKDVRVSRSNVRNLESLVALRGGLVQFSAEGEQIVHELRAAVRRAEAYFAEARPAYWRGEIARAQRELTEARDELSRKRFATRGGERPAAGEAAIRVRRAERRLELCREKERRARSLAIEIAQRCDELLGPITEVAEQCEVRLPAAASELERLIRQLQAYAHRT